MKESLMTSMLTLNTSMLEQTSWPSDDDQMTFASAYLQHDIAHTLWLVVPPVLLVLGCYGNVMTIVVMRAMRASESTGCLSVYFTALAVSDLFLIWTNGLLFWPEMALNTPLSYFHDLSCRIPFFVCYVSSMTSAWFLVSMTCQRMMSVVLPHRVDILCTKRTGKIITATIVIVCCMANLYIFFYYQVVYVEEGYQSCIINDKTIAKIFGFMHLCLASVTPFVFLLIANSVLINGTIQSIKMSGKMAGAGGTRAASRMAKLSSMTTTLMLTSAAFLLLSLPFCVLWIYLEMIGYFEGGIDDEAVSEQLVLVDTVCLLLWLSNSSINFYIYILSGRKFRQVAKRYMYLCFQALSRPRCKTSE